MARRSVVYGRELEGEETTFGVSGYTFARTFVLYDRKTETLWYPLEEGRMTALGGPLAGRELPLISAPKEMTLGEWMERHPDTLVMIPEEEEDG